jgi:hypothetical protein
VIKYTKFMKTTAVYACDNSWQNNFRVAGPHGGNFAFMTWSGAIGQLFTQHTAGITPHRLVI